MSYQEQFHHVEDSLISALSTDDGTDLGKPEKIQINQCQNVTHLLLHKQS